MPSEKTLKRIVIILGIFLVVGFGVLVAIIIGRAATIETTEASRDKAPLQMPGGSRPVELGKETNVTIIKVQNPDGTLDELVFDKATGEYLGKLVRDQ